MARKFRDIVAQTMSPEAQERAVVRSKAMLAELRLSDLRGARDLSQRDLAERLGLSQPDVSKIERRTDVYVSTLRRYIEAMGGELDIVARFPSGVVRISLFGDLAPALSDEAAAAMALTATSPTLVPTEDHQSANEGRYAAQPIPAADPKIIPIESRLEPRNRERVSFRDEDVRTVGPTDYSELLEAVK